MAAIRDRADETCGGSDSGSTAAATKLRRIPLPGGKALTMHDEEQAHELLEAIRADIRAGRDPFQAIAPYVRGPETLFRHHWHRFLAAKREQGTRGRETGRQLSAKRVKELERHEPRGHLAPLLGLPILGLGHGELEDWCGWLFRERNLAPKTVHHLVADVGTFLRWLEKRGDIPKAARLPEVHVPQYAPKIPPPAHVDAILDKIPRRLAGAFLARGRMGLRPSEAARANVTDWDSERQELTVHGKGGLVRVLPADWEVATWITEHRAGAFPLEPLFPNPDAHSKDKRWRGTAERKVLLQAMKDAKVPQYKPNEALRHAFATNTIGRVGQELMQPYLGHTDPKTTGRYRKLAPEHLRAVPRQEE